MPKHDPMTEKCLNCPITSSGKTFDFVLTSDNANKLSGCSVLKTYRSGDYIIRQGETVNGWQILRRGIARLFISGEDGSEHTIRFARPGELIGGCQFPGSKESCYSAVAIVDGTEVCHFPSAQYGNVIKNCPELAQALLSVVSQSLAEVYGQLHELTSTNARQRLARVLVRLADSHAGDRGPVRARDGQVVINMSRQQLADILGVTVETAVRALTSLKARGLVKTEGRSIVITSLPALRQFSEGPAR